VFCVSNQTLFCLCCLSSPPFGRLSVGRVLGAVSFFKLFGCGRFPLHLTLPKVGPPPVFFFFLCFPPVRQECPNTGACLFFIFFSRTYLWSFFVPNPLFSYSNRVCGRAISFQGCVGVNLWTEEEDFGPFPKFHCLQFGNVDLSLFLRWIFSTTFFFGTPFFRAFPGPKKGWGVLGGLGGSPFPLFPQLVFFFFEPLFLTTI